jgi:transcriptional regulator with XRE-family HTH domain
MLTPKLIKAARSLLEWRQEDLAQKSGISLPAINKFERRLSSPRQFTLDILQKTFEAEGVEFIDGPGVRLTDNIFNIQTLTGKNSPVLLWEDIVSTYRDGGEVLLCGLDETAWDDYTADLQRILAEYKKRGISWRALMREGDTSFSKDIEVDIEKNYRWIPKELFTQLPYYVYKDKLAFVLWGSPMRVVILTHIIIAETFKRQFEVNWKNGKIPKRK